MIKINRIEIDRKRAVLVVVIILAIIAGMHRYSAGKAWIVDAYWDSAEVLKAFVTDPMKENLRGRGFNVTDFSYQQNESLNSMIGFLEPGAELKIPIWRYNLTRFVYPLASAFLGLLLFWVDMVFVCMLLNVLAFLASVIVIFMISREMGISEKGAIMASIFFITSTTSLSLIISTMASPLASLLLMLSIYLLLRLSKADDNKVFALYIACATVAIMAREINILVCFLPLLAKTKLSWKKRIAASFIPAIIFILYLYSFQLFIPEFMHRIYGVSEWTQMLGPKARAPYIFAVTTALAFGLAGLFALFGIKKRHLRNPVLLWGVIFMLFFLLNPNAYFAQKHWFPMIFSISIFGALGVEDIHKRVKSLTPTLMVAAALVANFLLLLFRIIVFKYH